MNEIFTYLIATVGVVGMSALCSFLTTRTFSTKLFMISISIGICILIWQGMYPLFMIIPALAIPILYLFGSKIGDADIIPAGETDE